MKRQPSVTHIRVVLIMIVIALALVIGTCNAWLTHRAADRAPVNSLWTVK